MLFQAGEPIASTRCYDTCFFLSKEQQKVWIKQQSTDRSLFLGQLKSGDSIGEMGLILDQTRSATVMATDIALALRIKRILKRYVKQNLVFHWESRRHCLAAIKMDETLTSPADEQHPPIRMPSTALTCPFHQKTALFH